MQGLPFVEGNWESTEVHTLWEARGNYWMSCWPLSKNLPPDHRHLFQPHGNRQLFQIKKIKTKLELRKSSNDAWRKDIEAQEIWLENCGEDEEFSTRESKRLHRDLFEDCTSVDWRSKL